MELEDYFTDTQVNLGILRKRAYNYRWATLPEDTIPLTAADPDFPVAPEIRAAIKEYCDSGFFSYGPAEGLPEFRKIAAHTVNTRKHLNTKENLILPLDSAASAMYVIARWALKPGDEAIIFDPVDFLFKKSVEAAGGKVILCPLNSESGRIDTRQLKKLITPRTKLLGVCNPLNPLGQVLTRSELLELGQFAVENNLWIMNDEIWSDIVYSPYSHINIASLSTDIAEKTISVYGFSKTFGLAGLRVGFLVAPNETVYESLVETSHVRSTAGGVTTLSQIAAIAAYEKCWPWAEAFLKHLTSLRDYAVARLNAMPGVSCVTPEATYVLFPDIKKLNMKSKDVAQFLLEQERVAVVPGATEFFGPGAEGHLRICFSTSREILAEGLNRFEMGIKKLMK